MPDRKPHLPPQHQDTQPGIESEMQPRPESGEDSYRGVAANCRVGSRLSPGVIVV